MRGPIGRIDGVQSLPDLKEAPLPILEPVPTFSVGPKPQTQVLAASPGSRVGTANGRRPGTSSKKALPSLGQWKAHFGGKDAVKEPFSGHRWWISSSEILETAAVPGKKLPSLQSPSDAGDASRSKPSLSKASSPRKLGEHRIPGAWPSKSALEGRIERERSEKSFSRAHSMTTQSVASFDETDDEKTQYEYLKSEMHCRRTITMTERKRNHNAALARDKMYVQKLLKEGSEKKEDRLAREQALDGHWLQAAFSPVMDPSNYLSPALSGMLPRTKAQVKQATDVTTITRRASAVAHEVHEIVLEISDIQEAFRVCNLFCALTMPGGIGSVDAPVMSRQTFCHLACAAQGFASYDGSPPRLCRAARHFDSLAEEVLVKGSSTPTSGIVLLDCRSPGVENTPMARLFGKIVQDIVPDFDKGLDFDVVAQRGRAEFQARDRVFFRLLPQAGKYATRRLAHIKEQASHMKQWLEKTEAKPKDFKEQGMREAKEQKEKELLAQDRSRLLPVARTPKYNNRSRLNSPRTPNKERPLSTPRTPGTEVEEPKEERKDQWIQELQMKGENLLGHLFEPEVLRFMAQTSELFQIVFKAYADIPLATGQGHMSLSALVRFAADFGLFPHKVDFKTIQWLYNLESQAVPHNDEEPRRPSAPSMAPRKTRKKTMVNSDEGLLYHQKWLKPHLAWMSKDPASMSDAETRSCFVLTAIDDWLESHNLKVKETFANTDTASLGTFTLQDLQLVVNFMDFEDPPSSEDLQALMGLLVVRQGSTNIDFPTLEMARVAARLAKESRSRARNSFMKDLAKMGKSESSAFIFFTELAANLEVRGLAPESFYRMLDVDHAGLVSVVVIVRQARSLQPAELGERVWTAAMAIENPFAFIGKTVEDDVTQEEFVDLVEEIKEANRLREASFEHKHPLFISSGTVQPANSKESPFGVEAFVKVVMKMGILYLTYYGNEPQAQLTSFHKLLWLFIYMHWYFDSSRQKAEELLRQSGFERPNRSKSSGRPSSRGGDVGRRYPKHLPAMRQLLVRHPTIFMDVDEVARPGWATPARTADVVLQAAFRDVPKQGGSPEDGWKVEGLDDEDDAGAGLGPIEEDPQPLIRGPLALEQTLLATACHGHDLAETASEPDLGS